MVARIRKNDQVMVISGKDKGKVGTVIKVFPKKEKALVQGVSMVTKHFKARKQGQASGIIQKELPIALCKIMPVCPQTNKPCRVKATKTDAGKSVRVSHRSGQSF